MCRRETPLVAAILMSVSPALWAQNVPVVPADQAPGTFRIASGFRVELVAAEPLVRDPIGIAFDANGRLWVVELQNFMHDVNDSNGSDPIGTIAILEDTNGDGRMDRRTVFLSGLTQPRAVTFVEDGALVVDAPNLWFCRDTDGDRVCDEKTWVATYGVNGEPENNVGSLTPALDNWIYAANHGTRIRRENGQWRLEATPARGQWGMSQDDRGRLFYSTNREFIRGDQGLMMPPSEKVSDTWPLDGYYCWPGHPTPGINRGYWPGALRADGSMVSTTASCGPVIYRGDNFPAAVRGNAFSCEPAGNLIRRMVLTESGGTITARNASSQQEFFISTDERFRPVNLSNGPDGCLYVVDMYKGIIQHTPFMSDYYRDYALNHGIEQPLHLGRIWRVVSTSTPRAAVPRLQTAPSASLVGYLSHANGWLRDTAQRLLVERQDPSTVTALQTLAGSGTFPASLHAEWTLAGMGNIQPPGGNDVLLVYGYLDAMNTIAPGDVAIKARLEGMGYTVTMKEGPQSQTSDANGKVLVLISSTIGSDDVNTKFRDVAVPVIDWEHAIFDDMKMTGPTYWTDFGYDENDPGSLTIINAASPLAGGLSGTVTVIGPTNGIEFSNTIVWATSPSASAIRVASHAGEPNKIAVFAYEAGAPMVGMDAPARRVGFFCYRNTAAIATSQGWALFDAAVTWAANVTQPPPPTNAAPSLDVGAPADGAVFPTAPVDITVSGQTSDSDGAVVRIEFYDNGTYVGFVPIHFEPPGFVTDWTFTWTGVGPGSHTLTVVAVDNGGATTSVDVTLTVRDGGGGSDLMGHWAFDEGSGLVAAVSSGFGNDGTLVHGPVWDSGYAGGALRFNGADSHVLIGTRSSLSGLGPMTVSAWIYPDSMGGAGLGRIVAKENGTPGRWMLLIDGSRNLSFVKDHSTQELRRRSVPDVVSAGTWQHVAATWSGSAAAGGVHIHVNGVEVDYALNQDGQGTRLSDASIPLMIGNRPSLDRGFDGAIDEVLIYNRVLSASEIAALAAGTFVPSQNGGATGGGGSSSGGGGGCGATGMETVVILGLMGLLRRRP